MPNFTYYNSQSYRTLTHWQSGEKKKETEYSYVSPVFNGLIIDGQPYIVPYGLKEEGTTEVTGYLDNDKQYSYALFRSSVLPTLDNSTLVASTGDNILRGTEAVGKKAIRCVWDGGEHKLVSVPAKFTYTGTAPTDDVTITPSFTFNPIDTSDASLSNQTWKLEAVVSDKITCSYMLFPTVHRYYECYAVFNDGYSHLLPEYITGAITVYNDVNYYANGWTNAYNRDPDLTAGLNGSNQNYIISAVNNVLKDLWETPKPNVKVEGSATHISTLSAIPYPYHYSFYGGYTEDAIDYGFKTIPSTTFESCGFTTADYYSYDATSGWSFLQPLLSSFPVGLGQQKFMVQDALTTYNGMLCNGIRYSPPNITRLTDSDGATQGYLYFFSTAYTVSVEKTRGTIAQIIGS